MLFVKFTYISEIGRYNGLEIKPYMLHICLQTTPPIQHMPLLDLTGLTAEQNLTILHDY